MVSPFMSFATGALGAVNTQINKYQQTEAAEDLADRQEERIIAAEERAFIKSRELAGFNNAAKKELYNIGAKATVQAAEIKARGVKANKYIKFAGYEVPKGTSQQERVINILSAVSSDHEKFNAAMKDANKRPDLLRTIHEALQLGYSINVTQDNYNPDVLDLYGGSLGNNPEFLKVVRGWRNGNSFTPQPKPGIAAVGIVAGESVEYEDGDIVRAAAKVYKQNSYSLGERTVPELVAALGKRIPGGGFNKQIGAYEETNKYWTAATSPFVKYISTKEIAGERLTEEAKNWLYNPKHGFVKENGRLKSDAFTLVNIYGIQDAGFKKRGKMPAEQKFSELADTEDKISAEVKLIKESLPLARAARTTIANLIDQTKQVGVGSGALISVKAFLAAAPNLAKDAKGIMKGLLSSRQFAHPKLQDTREKFAKNLDALKTAEAKQDAPGIAAAQVKMLENMLAYQLTSILQGGTGGRTISDEDVTRALTMMGGTYDSLDQKLQKLAFIEELVEKTLDRGMLYSTLQSGDNANKYYAVQKVDRLMAVTNLHTFEKAINDFEANAAKKFGRKESKTFNELLPAIIRMQPENYNEDVYLNSIATVVGEGGTAKIVGNRFVVNKEVSARFKRATVQYNAREISKKQMQRILNKTIEEQPAVFDIISGELVTITYNTSDGGFDLNEGADVLGGDDLIGGAGEKPKTPVVSPSSDRARPAYRHSTGSSLFRSMTGKQPTPLTGR